MEYTYEFLRKCHGLRFQATLLNNHQEGIVKVTDEGITLCFGKKDSGYLCTFGRRDTLSFSKSTFTILPNDFKIIPRNPKTYKDWQVGDKIIGVGLKGEIAFRFGEIVLPVYTNPENAGIIYSCKELFDVGFRLMLTDAEKKLLSDKKEQWEPHDGDICHLRSLLYNWIFIKKDGIPRSLAYVCLREGNELIVRDAPVTDDNCIREMRPATKAEKKKLFKALRKEGKRWNAEKKILEDISTSCEFQPYSPVLVRGDSTATWKLRAFLSFYSMDSSYRATDGIHFDIYNECIPYNEKTRSLLGTSDEYKENSHD